ncbi:hypothetical protein [Pseudomonas sp. zfem002]|uniref:hypothetical protein n=1 Tax=Pseudomonas sp. zfem002 TaxID=3078197 RepID=UPI002928F271|nr:hypothetical protein [Pseudomonas sp. zfem002]MDU9394559.1 hypothetical protein [Pseudomonas sp. zfem002]
MNSSNRMAPDQIARLALAICATAEALGQAVTPTAAEVMADDLADFAPDVVAAALKSCRRELTARLTMGAILQRIQAADGRPGKDEAWSIALSASDEFETVVLTPEIRQAMSASNPILRAGDKIGARMAFMSAYERLVANSRADASPVTWGLSLGFDPERRAIAVESAVRAQLITHEAGTQYLADLRIAPLTEDGKAIAGLITGEQRTHVSDGMRARLDEIRMLIASDKTSKKSQGFKNEQRKRVLTYLRKRDVRSTIQAYGMKVSS